MATIRKVKKATASCAAKTKRSPQRRSKIGSPMFTEMTGKRAYYIWQELGKPQGQDFDIWVQAEREMRAKLK